jgi:trimeric autotransporter adhesin
MHTVKVVLLSFIAIFMTSVACVKPQEVPCGDLQCPSDAVCTTRNDATQDVNLCQFPDDIAACAGKPDGTACTDRKDRAGACFQGACSANGVCGDGLQAAGEVCDDGNRNDVDGCTSDCRRNEWQAAAVVGSPTNAAASALRQPLAVASDANGNTYTTSQNRVLRIDRSGSITTVAGTGEAGFSGDGGQATSARLLFPTNIVVDGFGNLIIADTENHRIRRVDRNGVITTIAGTGVPGFSGDGAPAINAQLANPWGLALDGFGSLFIADKDNHRIRRIGPTGVITTFAGDTPGFGGDGSAATLANLLDPIGVAVDRQGNAYIADSGNYRIRKVSVDGKISTVAGNGTKIYDDGVAATATGFHTDSVAVDNAGNLFIASLFNSLVLRVSDSGIVTGVAGTISSGIDVDENFKRPQSVAVDSTGILVADRDNNRIAHVDSNRVVTTVAGTGLFVGVRDGDAAISEEFGIGDGYTGSDLSGIGSDGNGNLFVAAYAGHRVRRVDSQGLISTVAGTGKAGYNGDNQLASAAQLKGPSDVTVDTAGNIYIADTENYRIRKVDKDGIITTIAGIGEPGFSGDGSAATAARLAQQVLP